MTRQLSCQEVDKQSPLMRQQFFKLQDQIAADNVKQAKAIKAKEQARLQPDAKSTRSKSAKKR